MKMKRFTLGGALLAAWVAFNACQDTTGVSDTQLEAKVGTSVLSKTEVSAHVPIGLTNADSLAAAKKYVDAWIEEHLLYEYGLRNLNNAAEIEAQVADYRCQLIGQSYANMVLSEGVEEASEADCLSFYEQHPEFFRLDESVLQGLYFKFPLDVPQLAQLREMLNKVHKGDLESIEPLEQFAMQRALSYDNFLDHWVAFSNLVDNVPVKWLLGEGQVQRKVYEMKDATNVYFIVITDFRRKGEVQPFEYAQPLIREQLTRQKRQDFRKEFIDHLYEEAVKSGMIVKSHD